MARIFISYSRKDEDFARQIATSLSDLGADIWIDVEDIPAGMNWSTAIQQGLNLPDHDAAQNMLRVGTSTLEEGQLDHVDAKKPGCFASMSPWIPGFLYHEHISARIRDSR